MAVLLICKVYHLLDGHTLPKFVANKIFLLYRASRHVTGAVNQEQLATLATGTSEVGRHQSHPTLEVGIISR